MNVIIIIPARGGSKGIPRKNLRMLAGKPLLSYVIKTALNSKYQPDVFVSSEDDEILELAQQCGAGIHKREHTLAEDSTTLDPVIYDAYSRAAGKTYDLVVTIQPTSPLLSTVSLDAAIQQMEHEPQTDTLIAAMEDTHLTWKKDEKGRFVPAYKERVNRQFLEPSFRETGAFFMTRPEFVTPKSRIGKNVQLFLLGHGEQIDIDTAEDWNLCEYYLRKRRILFVVSGYPEIGLGHVYNTLSLANEIVNHEIIFLVDKKSELARRKIAADNYTVFVQKKNDILDDIAEIDPDIVINDRLDTTAKYVRPLRKAGCTVINFEDLGTGASYAHLVINAMYPATSIQSGHYSGEKYFCLKSDFYYYKPQPVQRKVKRVVLAFGGVDPNNYTLKVMEAIYEDSRAEGIELDVILGMGYTKLDTLKRFKGIKIAQNVKSMAAILSQADLAFTSAGRTTFEMAALGIPTIVLAQNKRELSHFFCKPVNGFVHLGLGTLVSDRRIRKSFTELVGNFEHRKQLQQLLLRSDLRGGKARVIKLITEAVNNHLI